MKILLWSDDLMSRVRIESRWKAAGPHVDADVFREAKAAGASEYVARGSAVERVLERLGNGG